MEAVIFIGLQAAGKSSFYRQVFIDSHIRLNLDMLKTRHREQLLFEACLAAKQPVVIDNTNPRKEDRQKYIAIAKESKFEVTGYYFQSELADCKQRNEQRQGKAKIPLVGLLDTYKKLELPSYTERFDRLFYVRLDSNKFIVEEWDTV